MYWIAKYLAHILQNIQVLVKNIFFISRNVNNITLKLDKNNKGLQLYLDDKFKNIEKQITSGVIPIFSF